MKKGNSIIYKIFSSTTVVLFFISLVIFIVILLLFPLAYRQSIQSENIEISQVLAKKVSKSEASEIPQLLNNYESHFQLTSIISDSDNQIVYMSNLAADNKDVQISADSSMNGFIDLTYESKELTYNVNQNIVIIDDTQYLLTTLVYLDTVSNLIKPFMLMFPILAAVVLIQSLLVAYVASLIMTKPITILSKKANAITHLDFDNKYKWNSTDEFGLLSDDLEEMQTKMKQVISYLEDDALLKNQIALEEQRQQISILSHELNTPLTVLKMQTELLISKAEDEQSKTFLMRNLQKVDEVTSLVDQVLNYKSVEDTEVICLNDFLDELISTNYSGYVFSYDYRMKLDIEISTIYLSRLLTNLINNAIKYNYNDQAISIVIAEDKLSIENYHIPNLMFNKEEILKPYVRSNNIKCITGQGLGLFICRRICMLNEFEFDIESQNQKFYATIQF